MAYTFGDGFDLYAATADAVSGYWDSGVTTGWAIASGRFSGSQAFQNIAGTGTLIKSSGVNDAVHHIVCAFRQTAALSGTTLGLYFQLTDASTNQVCIVFRSDGAVLLTSATPGGTVLATYTGAVTAQNTWFAFEFEVVINNTTGAFRARKNGNTSNDFDSGATLNTRPGANAYANKLTIAVSVAVNNQQFDDLLWRSDASSVAWAGDIRCYTRMPASTVGTPQFAVSPNPVNASQTAVVSSTGSKAANAGIMSAFTAAYSGTIASGVVQITTGATGNMKAAIYDSTRTTVLATSNTVVNPVSGANTITFGTPLTVTRGTTYHLAVDQDATIVYNVTGGSQWAFTTTYASFPAAAPSLTPSQPGPVFTAIITPTNSAEYVNEAQQDGTTSYVYDSTVNDVDFYAIASLSPAPASVVAVTTRGFIEKSDAGTRTGSLQIKSGGTTVATSTVTLGTNFGWAWRTDTTDPNTGSAWTAGAVSAVNIGPKMVS